MSEEHVADAGTEEGQTAPGAEGAGQGGDASTNDGGDAPDYGGFGSLEELTTAHKTATEQNAHLESLKGRMGSEVGSLKQQLAERDGQIKAYQTRPSQPAGPTSAEQIQALQAKLNDGSIGMTDFLSERDAIRDADMEAKFNKNVDQRFARMKAETDNKASSDKYMADNPGYEQAFNDGHLQQFMQQGMSARQAYTQYQNNQTQAENERLKAEIDEAKKQGQEEGFQKGTAASRGKSAAETVLGDSKGVDHRAGGDHTPAPRNHQERVRAGSDLIARIRSGGA